MARNCYIYTRVSTAAQVDGYSLDAQIQTLRKYAEYRDLTIAGEYCDAGKSGKNITGRPEFTRMMDDIMTQKDDVGFVLVFKLSRFGRNSADILRSVQTLEDFGVNLVSVNESIDSSTSNGKLTMTILSAVAEMEHENISVQFQVAKMQKIKTGVWGGGPVPFGYKKADKELVVDAYNAEIVRKTYELYGLEQNNATSVADKLNQSEYELKDSKTGERKPFTYSFVVGVLDNPFYCGRVWYNRRTNKKDVNGQIIKYGSDHAFMVMGTHEPIISEEQWDRVHEKRVLLADMRKKVKSNVHVLSGIVKCPICGKNLTGSVNVTKHRNGTEGYCRPIYYYCCKHSTNQNGKTCSFTRKLNQEIIDGLVFEIIGKLQFNENFKEELEKALCGNDSVESKEEELRKLRIELNEAELSKNRIGEQLDGLNPLNSGYDKKYETLSFKLDESYDCIDGLEVAIAKARKALEISRVNTQSFSDISVFIANIKTLIGKMTSEEKKELCNSFMERIEVFPEERDDGRIIKSISFKFPLSFDGSELSRVKAPKDSVQFSMDCSNFDVSLPEKGPIVMKTLADGSQKVIVNKPTYTAIKDYVLNHFRAKVSSLNIAQIKRKYGIDVGISYNKPVSTNNRVPRCVPQKEKMILEALKHFDLLEQTTEYMEDLR